MDGRFEMKTLISNQVVEKILSGESQIHYNNTCSVECKLCLLALIKKFNFVILCIKSVVANVRLIYYFFFDRDVRTFVEKSSRPGNLISVVNFHLHLMNLEWNAYLKKIFRAEVNPKLSKRCFLTLSYWDTIQQFIDSLRLSVMNFVLFYLVICQLVASSLAYDIKGRLDLRLRNVTQHDISRSYFSLYKIQEPDEKDSYSELEFYSKSAALQNIHGEFTFTDVPVDIGLNKTTYFTLNSHSTEFNLKPNRVLIKITGNGQDQEPSLTAFENKFGREYFASPDITFPETLKPFPLDTSGRLVITTMNKQPFRRFMQIRNPGIFQSGPIASVLRSKFKLAGVVTVLFLVLFPIMLEKFDPETAKQMRQEKLQRENAKYVSK